MAAARRLARGRHRPSSRGFRGVVDRERKLAKPVGGGVASVDPPKIDDTNATRLTFAMTSALPGKTGLAAYSVRPTRWPPAE